MKNHESGSTRLRARALRGLAATAALALAAGGVVSIAAPANATTAPTLTVSKSAGLAYNGETITATGANFAPNTMLYLTECDFAAAPMQGCNMDLAQVVQVTTSATGTFTTPVTVRATFTAAKGLVDCTVATTMCALGSTNGANPADRTQDSSAQIAFAAKPVTPAPVVSAPTKAKITSLEVKGKVSHQRAVIKWKKAVAQGSAITGYTVQVKVAGKKWHKAGKTSAAKHKLTWKKVKAGKKYWFRVIAKSAAGDSTSAKKSVKSKK